jgi:hypothetical protein
MGNRENKFILKKRDVPGHTNLFSGRIPNSISQAILTDANVEYLLCTRIELAEILVLNESMQNTSKNSNIRDI